MSLIRNSSVKTENGILAISSKLPTTQQSIEDVVSELPRIQGTVSLIQKSSENTENSISGVSRSVSGVERDMVRMIAMFKEFQAAQVILGRAIEYYKTYIL